MPFDKKAYMKEYHKSYREKNKDRIDELRKKWTKENPDRVKKSSKRWADANKEKISSYNKLKYDPDKQRVRKYKRLYGITIDEYNAMFEKQEGRCAICQSTDTAKGEFLCVDHDHKTGKVRGLLCHDCNTGIGKFKDSVHLLKVTINYLEESLK